MTRFVWPKHIRFDDSEQDIKEARKLWLAARGLENSYGTAGEFLEFMEAYATQVDLQRLSEEVRSKLA